MKKEFRIGLIAALSSLTMISVGAGESSANANSDFINKLSPSVQKATSEQNLYASLQMAQAILESGWGQSRLSKEANNYFGVKGSYNGQYVIMNTAEYDKQGHLYYTDAAFRKYPSPFESMRDNASQLRQGTDWNPNIYSGTWRENASTGKQAANGLVPSYATDPKYAVKLKDLINSYDLESLDFTAKYKVGDVIKISNGAQSEATGWNIQNRRGWLGIVKKVSSYDSVSSRFKYYIEFPNGEWNEQILEQDLTNATGNRYSLGQQIQISASATSESNGWNLVDHRNWIGTVESFKPTTISGGWVYYVKYPDGSRNENVYEQDLKTPSPAKYRVGQMAQVSSGAVSEAGGWNLKDHRNWIGTIKSVKVNNLSNSHYEYWIDYPDGARNEHVLEQDLTNPVAAKYKSGDTVQISNVANSEIDGWNLIDHRNWIGTVKSVKVNNQSNSHYEYWIDYPNGARNEHVDERDLMKPASPRYAVGSVIQISSYATTESGGWNLKDHRNWIGTVKSVKVNNQSNSHYEYWIQYPDGARNEHVLEQDLLSAAAAKFRVGQRVKISALAQTETNGYSIVARRNWVGTVKKISFVNHSNSRYSYWIAYDNGEWNELIAEEDLLAQ
ncbi:glucosaminidase domain-containing protein [Weissella confusa]|uniref:glucosaminidase domain-containing protein n=1 Tax=Weissella confusa TaxID=1583 RepID=UPI0018F22FC2|nr:glucosaminidase domain-containing protein [Weissella confusa]MBJ7649514.1 mannosyl-glycoprotein endo-beta-N-acetylglucosamidase [Weissella confusa]MBJ7662073.1 mannosyl-glycoprotein endo-beta-N-acetylglucosamidase [Weissella confusa]